MQNTQIDQLCGATGRDFAFESTLTFPMGRNKAIRVLTSVLI